MSQSSIHRAGVFCKSGNANLGEVVPELVRWLKERKIDVLLDEAAAKAAAPGAKATSREQLVAESDLVIVLGGDGTLLAAARAMPDREVPMMPVNLGSLGFLTSVKLSELYTMLELFLEGKHRINLRMMLQAEVLRGGAEKHGGRALNEAVVNQAALARLMDFDVHVDGSHIGRYRADGLIVATPTGSTAYSLAAGGPIVHPAIDAFLITPICPHMLTHRPLAVPGDSKIEITFSHSGEPVHLTLDGQTGFLLEPQDRISITKSPIRLPLVRPWQKTYFEVLREKLRWGER
jgi:NAD+ kinase